MNKLNEVQLAFFFSKNSNFFDNSKLNNKLYLLFRNDFDVLPTSSMPPMNPAVPLFNWNCKKIMIEYNATRFDLRFRPEDGEDGFERAIDYIKRLASIFSETNLNIVNLGIIVSVLNDDAKNFIQKHAEMNDVFQKRTFPEYNVSWLEKENGLNIWNSIVKGPDNMIVSLDVNNLSSGSSRNIVSELSTIGNEYLQIIRDKIV